MAQVSAVLRKTVGNWSFDGLSGGHLQSRSQEFGSGGGGERNEYETNVPTRDSKCTDRRDLGKINYDGKSETVSEIR